MRRLVIIGVSLLLAVAVFATAGGKQETGAASSEAAATGMVEGKYREAPMLAELVAQGELPPVDERVPKDPLVVEPYEKVGKYGGTLNVVTQYTTVPVGAGFATDCLNGFVNPNPEGNAVFPHFAKDVETSSDLSTYTIYLREGVKWSDGQPFTTEDMMFWYEDWLLHEEVTPVIDPSWIAGGEVVKVTAIDDYTIRFEYTEPQPLFLGWPLSKGTQHHRMIKAKHYLSQFHKDYVSEDKLEEMMDEADYDTWRDFFLAQAQEYCALPANPGAPAVTSYVCTDWNSERHVYERNPYYWKVDTAGNQLPYIDRIDSVVVTDAEVAQGKMIAGEVDYNGFITTTKNYPLYKQNEERGGYRTILWDSGKGSEVFFYFNLSYDDPDMRNVFQDVRFRRAMSVAIDREEINEFLYFGRAEVRNYTLLSTSKYFEDRFATAYTQYDPDQAGAWLDDMGLVDSDGDGWRDLANGEPFSFVIEFTSSEDPLKIDTVELVTQYWQDVGINVTSKELAGELWGQRLNGNEIACSIWHGGWETGILFPASNPLLAGNGRYAWPKYWDHYFGGQEIDQEIPAVVQELYDTWVAATTASNEADLVRLGKKILEMQADNVWLIGTVGLAPHPIIAKKNLRNVPETGHYTWEVQWMISRNPEQFFFE